MLSEMEAFLPAWELNMVRHLVLHMPQRILYMGPPYAHSMFPYERAWNTLTNWMTATVHPEATMMTAYRHLVRRMGTVYRFSICICRPMQGIHLTSGTSYLVNNHYY